MILMKPIHNANALFFFPDKVVIPHKVNDFNETNSQLYSSSSPQIICCDSSQS